MEAYLGAALGFASAIAIAVQALAIRLATRRGRILDILLLNIVISALIFVLLTLFFIREPVITRRSFLAFAGAGIVSLLVGRAFYFAGIQRVGASRSEPIKASMPLHATVFAVFILGERVSGIQFVGIVLIIAGVVLVTWEGTNEDRLAGKKIPWFGLSLPFIAALLLGLEPIFASIGFRDGTSVVTGAAIQTSSASIVLIAVLAWRKSIPSIDDLPSGDVRWYVISGLASVMAILTYYAGLNVSRVGIVVPISQTSPLIVVVLSLLFLRKLEYVSLRLAIASVVIIAGAIAVTVAS